MQLVSLILLCCILSGGAASRSDLAESSDWHIPTQRWLKEAPAASDAPAPVSSSQSEKLFVATPEELLQGVVQGYAHIEIVSHLNMSSLSLEQSTEFLISHTGSIYLKGNCENSEPPSIDFKVQEGQCVITLGALSQGFISALGAEVILSNLVLSRNPNDTAQPSICAIDSSIFLDAAAIIVTSGSSGTAQGIRLRGSRALLSGVHLEGNRSPRGGAVDAMGSTVTIDDASLLQDNHATDSGGAVWLAYSVLRMSETTCINNSAALCVTPLFMSQGHATCKGGGAVAMQAPTDTQMRDITFSLNKAETLGGAVYMYGSLGNNTLRVYKTFRFQGNTANSVRQDIAVSSSGVISFDEVPTGASSVIGTGVDGFEWNPAENSNMNSNLSVLYDASTGSTAEDFPKLLERTESWIVDAEQVFQTEEGARVTPSEALADALGATALSPSSREGDDVGGISSGAGTSDSNTDRRTVVILVAISATLLLCTLSLAAAVIILRGAVRGRDRGGSRGVAQQRVALLRARSASTTSTTVTKTTSSRASESAAGSSRAPSTHSAVLVAQAPHDAIGSRPILIDARDYLSPRGGGQEEQPGGQQGALPRSWAGPPYSGPSSGETNIQGRVYAPTAHQVHMQMQPAGDAEGKGVAHPTQRMSAQQYGEEVLMEGGARAAAGFVGEGGVVFQQEGPLSGSSDGTSAGADGATRAASWYAKRGAAAPSVPAPPPPPPPMPQLRIGAPKKSARTYPWRRMFSRADPINDSPELNTINEEEEPGTSSVFPPTMHSPASARCAVIMVPSTASTSSSSDSETEGAGGAGEFRTTVTVQRENAPTFEDQSPDSSSVGSSSMNSLSSTLSNSSSSNDSGSPVARSTHRVERVLMTDVDVVDGSLFSSTENQLNSMEGLPAGLQRALISDPAISPQNPAQRRLSPATSSDPDGSSTCGGSGGRGRGRTISDPGGSDPRPTTGALDPVDRISPRVPLGGVWGGPTTHPASGGGSSGLNAVSGIPTVLTDPRTSQSWSSSGRRGSQARSMGPTSADHILNHPTPPHPALYAHPPTRSRLRQRPVTTNSPGVRLKPQHSMHGMHASPGAAHPSSHSPPGRVTLQPLPSPLQPLPHRPPSGSGPTSASAACNTNTTHNTSFAGGVGGTTNIPNSSKSNQNEVEFGMSVIDGLQHRLAAVNSGSLFGPTSGSGVLDNPHIHGVDSIMRSDYDRSAATDGFDATSTFCSNTFFLVPPRSISPTFGPDNGPKTEPDLRDLQCLVNDFAEHGDESDMHAAHASAESKTQLRRISQSLKET